MESSWAVLQGHVCTGRPAATAVSSEVFAPQRKTREGAGQRPEPLRTPAPGLKLSLFIMSAQKRLLRNPGNHFKTSFWLKGWVLYRIRKESWAREQ